MKLLNFVLIAVLSICLYTSEQHTEKVADQVIIQVIRIRSLEEQLVIYKQIEIRQQHAINNLIDHAQRLDRFHSATLLSESPQ